MPNTLRILALARAVEELAAEIRTGDNGDNGDRDANDPDVGDIVQLVPSADQTFGGMLARITQATRWSLRGYLLVPHRGGCRDAWVRLKPCEVARIGTLKFPEATWSFRGNGGPPRH